MKTKQLFLAIFILVLGLLVSGCGPGQVFGPTITPTPTVTATATATFTPIPTDTPTITPTLTPVTQTFNITVPANVFWFNTGIPIAKGQHVTIEATGTVNTYGGRSSSNSDPKGQTKWTCDESLCPIMGAYYGELVGRLGILAPFRVGNKLDMTAPSKGVLLLSVNDTNFKDNKGEFLVTVTVR
jgi:hypothetical protein